jgi:aminoglycoside 3-N-acetyltransferase I
MIERLSVTRLGRDDRTLARAMFTLLNDVFEEPGEDLSGGYIDRLLGRVDFWALAAIVDGVVVGGLTAHELPMTRSESNELFIYDIAVDPARQRRGIGRALIDHLLTAAASAGIEIAFVPADDDDEHALAFYEALGGAASEVTFFEFGVQRRSAD